MSEKPTKGKPVSEAVQHQRNTSHQKATEIKQCPNPECKKGKVKLRGPLQEDNMCFHVRCDACGLIGPRHVDSLTAINLWNGIYRPGEPYGERCWFWHDWSKWKDHEVNKRSISVRGQEGGDIYKGDYLTQVRWCKRCGEKEYKTKRIFDVDHDTK